MSSRNQKKRGPRTAFAAWSDDRRPGDALTIPSFCRRNAISESKYRGLKRQGKGPREIELDRRIIITEEAEADWRREREAETAEKRTAEAKRRGADTEAEVGAA
jgi:hypothetical protein